MSESKVWIRKRSLRNGKASYHLRWICPHSRAWKSRHVGTDHRRATYEAAKLEQMLLDGTYTVLRKTTWTEFTEEHVRSYENKETGKDQGRALWEFAKVAKVSDLPRVTFGHVESYRDWLRGDGRKPSTINQALRKLRAAFNAAIRRGYIAKNPMHGWRFDKLDEKPPRVINEAEETAILKASASHDLRWTAFIKMGFATGGRRNEIFGLTWDRVDFDGGRVHFANTKGKRDRFVPIPADVVTLLRRLQAQTLKQGGPFIGVRLASLSEVWRKIVAAADVPGVIPHDLRKTCCTRLIRAGVPLPHVQKFMGHANINTTLKYYNWTDDGDLRAAADKLARYTAG